MILRFRILPVTSIGLIALGWCYATTVHAIIFSEASASHVQRDRTGPMRSAVKLHYTPFRVFGGCGLVVDSHHVLTAKHAVSAWKAGMVTVGFDGKQYRSNKFNLHPSSDVDLAVIETIERLPDSVVPAELVLCGDLPKLNQQVWLGGYGLSGIVGQSYIPGQFVSGHNRIIKVTDHRAKIRFDAATDQAVEADEVFPAIFDSGSPVFLVRDDECLLLGITITVSNRSSPALGDNSSQVLLSHARPWLDEIVPGLKWEQSAAK